ncbi:LysR substrate-binding domain-containing protein [Methylophilus flavus]|jgi:LysR family transcriptional regulator, cys regulon transcriptional activator|uniref:LysR substrate-binding domain-containing protein n=1 Tax=Methylophilus flavus TaxID=640084 RepID=A0ABW3PHZ4_9PROT
MNFQQLKIVREAVKLNYNLTEVGKVLFISQSGVSKSLTELENELGIEIFNRSKNRLIGLTSEGEALIPIISKILSETQHLNTLSSQMASKSKGNLFLATTHAQARYALPEAIKNFVIDYPDVHFTLHESSPLEICELLKSGEADIGIATEGVHLNDALVTIPWYGWYHSIIAKPDHPIFESEVITLEQLCQFPIITYHSGLTGRSRVDKAFSDQGLYPDIPITALDADIIKTYVELGLGIGIVASMSFDPVRDTNLKSVSAAHLFEKNVTKIALRKNHYLRPYVYDFVSRLSPSYNTASIKNLIGV